MPVNSHVQIPASIMRGFSCDRKGKETYVLELDNREPTTETIKRYSTVKNFRSILTQLVVSWRISFRENVQHLMPSFSFVPVLLIVIYKARFKVAET